MIHLVQCLCPSRHCVLAVVSDEARTEAESRLRAMVALLLARRAINPWCALCGAPASTWRYEAAATVYQTIEEAQASVERLEEANRRTQEALIASGRAYDSKRRSEN